MTSAVRIAKNSDEPGARSPIRHPIAAKKKEKVKIPPNVVCRIPAICPAGKTATGKADFFVRGAVYARVCAEDERPAEAEFCCPPGVT